VRTVDEGLEVLTGCKAGSVEEEGAIHHRVVQRLRHLADRLKQFGAPSPAPPAPAAPAPPAPPPTPTPPRRSKRSRPRHRPLTR